jgi:methyl-accepting chemotaxis protein
MAIQQQLEPLKHKRLSLSIRISFGLVLAAILPLIITLLFSEFQTRPTLIAQANTAMESDANSRVQLIDAYFNERLLDVKTITQVASVQTFMAATPDMTPTYSDLATHAAYGLAAGIFRDKNYASWDLFDPQGQIRLYYPTNLAPAKRAGNAYIPAQYITAEKAGKTLVSGVYYSPQTHISSVDIYSPMYSADQSHTYIGFMRATLNLTYITNVVKGDQGSNGTGSYAYIVDQNGVRIADDNSAQLFTAVAPLNPQFAQQVKNEALYGRTGTIPVQADSTVATQIKNTASKTTFQTQPAGQKSVFQGVQQATTTVPWHYVVLSPVNTVTAIANRELYFTILVAVAVTVLVAIIGLIMGRNMTRPIMSAVAYLRDSSHAMTTLSTTQQDASTEQTWVVNSTQVGLQSVQYYTEAIEVAGRQLKDLSNTLLNNWEQIDRPRARQSLEKIASAASYIENATNYQHVSNEKLATAIEVATQVTKQLVDGSTSAAEAATQLEEVVTQLRNVIGQ